MLRALGTNDPQNFEVSGFGTPEAAIILSSGTSSGSWNVDGVVGMGFWDGTNMGYAGEGYDHGNDVGSSDSSRQSTSDAYVVWWNVKGTANNIRRATVSGTATNGITLTWSGDNTGIRPYVTVILLKGLNGAQVGHRTANTVDQGTTQTTTSGITPKLILFAGRLSDLTGTTNGDAPRVFFGFACDNGSTIDNYAIGCRNRIDFDPTDCNGTVRNDACIFLDHSPTNWCTVTTMTSGSFTTTSDINGTVFASSHFYLALDFDENVQGWAAGTPTASGSDWRPYTASWTPQWAFMFPTGFENLNQDYSNNEDGVEFTGIYSAIKDPASSAAEREDGHYLVIENDTADPDTVYSQNRHDTNLRIARCETGQTTDDLIVGSSPTFDSSGILYTDANITHDAGQAHQVVGFFVEEYVEAGGATTKAAYHYNRLRNPF